jgi:hypothetical protein
MIGFMEKNIDDDDNNNNNNNNNDDDSSGKFMKYFIFQIWIILIFVSSLLLKKIPGFILLCNIGIRGLMSMANFVNWWDLELNTSGTIHRMCPAN